MLYCTNERDNEEVLRVMMPSALLHLDLSLSR